MLQHNLKNVENKCIEKCTAKFGITLNRPIEDGPGSALRAAPFSLIFSVVNGTALPFSKLRKQWCNTDFHNLLRKVSADFVLQNPGLFYH